MINRRHFGLAVLSGIVAGATQPVFAFEKPEPPLGLSLDDNQLNAGREFLKKHLSIDLHAHPGLFFVDSENPSPLEQWFMTETGGGAFVDQAMEEIRTGHLTMAHFATVADRANLGLKDKGVYGSRPFAEGELWADHKRQVSILKDMLAKYNMVHVLKPADIRRAKQEGRIAALLSTEGAGYLDGHIERIEALAADGIRSVQLVHYNVNALGDIQTEAPQYNGLSDFGKQATAALSKAGIMVDVAHATMRATADAAEATTQPLVLSHSSLHVETPRHPRHLSLEHARLIADTGGIVGAWPAGLTNRSFGDFIGEIDILVEAIGIDHVAIGTDMDGNYKPVFNNYTHLYLIPAALLARGYAEEDVAKIMGENFMRVFAAVVGDDAKTAT